MDQCLLRIRKYVEAHGLFARGSQAVIGLSGGADSVFLLHALCAMREQLEIDISCVHVNHGIRGKEAERDQDFCMELCTGLDIPCVCVCVDAPAYAEQNRIGLEEAARILRYRALERVRDVLEENSGRPAVIAVAHHAGDQAETVLHNLIRGTGLRGLSGMEAKAGHIVRPLLEMEKDEMLAWLSEHGHRFVMDSSNFDQTYTRNRLRADVLPSLEEINAQAAAHINQTAALAAEADAFFAEAAAAFVDAYAETEAGADSGVCPRNVMADDAELQSAQNGNSGQPDFTKKVTGCAGDSLSAAPAVTVPADRLKQEKPVIRRYVMMELVRRLGVPLKDWGAKHFSDMDALLFRQGGAHLDLPCRVSADFRKKRLTLQVNSEVLSMKRRRERKQANNDYR